MFATLRDAEARGLDVESRLSELVQARTLVGVEDVAAVMHHRVNAWAEGAGRRRRAADNLIAGLIPRVTGIADADMALALSERDEAMQRRARTLAEAAVEQGQPWTGRLGAPPAEHEHREAWISRVATIAAYREQWSVRGDAILGCTNDVTSIEQLGQYKRARVALEEAIALTDSRKPDRTGTPVDLSPAIERREGVGL